MKKLAMLTVLLLLTFAPASAEEQMARPENVFVIIHAPGEAWEKGVPFREQPLVMLHVQYMMELLESGSLVVGGPFMDDSGGMVVVRAQNLKEAQALASKDPSVEAGLLTYKLRPWMIAMRDTDHDQED